DPLEVPSLFSRWSRNQTKNLQRSCRFQIRQTTDSKHPSRRLSIEQLEGSSEHSAVASDFRRCCVKCPARSSVDFDYALHQPAYWPRLSLCLMTKSSLHHYISVTNHGQVKPMSPHRLIFTVHNAVFCYNRSVET